MPHSLRVAQRKLSNTHVIASSQPSRKSSRKPRFLKPSVAGQPARVGAGCLRGPRAAVCQTRPWHARWPAAALALAACLSDKQAAARFVNNCSSQLLQLSATAQIGNCYAVQATP